MIIDDEGLGRLMALTRNGNWKKKDLVFQQAFVQEMVFQYTEMLPFIDKAVS